ncbi:MAG: 30S ribosomal protein S20 [Chloroflexi bacterium]|nr:30S ribosomal protein S20 [Chloroflexota bacterium]
MGNIPSAEKAARRSVRQRARNRVVISTTRSYIKQANAQIVANDPAKAEQATKQAIRALDKAAEKGILKKNNASRRKSRLMKKLNALRAAK